VTAPEAAALAVTRNAEDRRFEAILDGHTSVLTYREAAGRVTLIHTEVPPELRGRRIADTLARAALDDARRRGLQVRPLCPLRPGVHEAAPEYADLVAPGTPTGGS
jgi:predicted GNAT family acetyltransferase